MVNIGEYIRWQSWWATNRAIATATLLYVKHIVSSMAAVIMNRCRSFSLLDHLEIHLHPCQECSSKMRPSQKGMLD